MIKDFATYINEGLFDRNQSEFSIRKTDNGIEQLYIPKTMDDLCEYIKLDIEQAKKDGTYPNVNLNNIDVSKLGNDELNGLFGDIYNKINPDISNWNIKYIPNNFFDSNEQIKEFTIPDSVTSIGDYAFASCSSLTSVTIPNSVTSIGAVAFCDCDNLIFVTIPSSVTSIGSHAFAGCCRFTSITIPNSVTSIEYRSFAGCRSLTSIEIPNNITSIGYEAFHGCSGLTSVTIPNSVTSIEYKAFAICSGLTSVTIPKHCHIDANSFPENCKIIRRDD